MSISIIIFFIGVKFHKDDEDISRILEPSACARKYFNIASDSWNLFDILISGIKDSILISSAVHVNSQLFLDIAIMELMIIVEYKILFIGDILIDIKI